LEEITTRDKITPVLAFPKLGTIAKAAVCVRT